MCREWSIKRWSTSEILVPTIDSTTHWFDSLMVRPVGCQSNGPWAVLGILPHLNVSLTQRYIIHVLSVIQ